MLTLRFQRQGKKKDFIFRIVAVDSRFSSKSGKAKEILGWWDPKKNKFELKKERIEHWLKNGAQVSNSCFNLFVKSGIIKAKKRPIRIRKSKKAEAKEIKKEEISVESAEKSPEENLSE